MHTSSPALILAIVTAKGGVGKSTTTASLAGHYAAQGERVHIIDATEMKTVTRWLAPRDKDGNLIPLATTSMVSVSGPEKPSEFGDHYDQVIANNDADVILIDIAGAFEQTAVLAMAKAHFSIVPMKPNEADISEGLALIRTAERLFDTFGQKPLYRALITHVQPVSGGKAQEFGFQQIEKLNIPRFATTINLRTIYAEIGITHEPPHYADAGRGDTVMKAREEISAVASEIEALLQPPPDVRAIA